MLFTQAITILLSATVAHAAAEDVNHLLSSPSGGLRHAQRQIVENVNHLELRVLQQDEDEEDDMECSSSSEEEGTAAPSAAPKQYFETTTELQHAIEKYDEQTTIDTYGTISDWDVSRIEDLSSVFSYKTDFNEDISNWNTSKVTNMSKMFWNAQSFNIDLSEWDTSKVTLMIGMFSGATVFNQNLSEWDTSKATNINSMFYGATAFNQNLCSWYDTLGSGINSISMFTDSGCPNNNIVPYTNGASTNYICGYCS